MTGPAAHPADDDTGDDNVVFLPDAADQMRAHIGPEATEEARKAARDAQARRRAEFEYGLAGATKRAAKLPKALTGAWGHGVANLMLMKLLNGEVRPTTAKEAADVMKAAHEVARSAQGRGPSDGPLSPEERAENMRQVSQLEQTLAERAKTLSDEFLAGAPETAAEELPAAAEAEPVEWDFGEQVRDPDPA